MVWNGARSCPSGMEQLGQPVLSQPEVGIISIPPASFGASSGLRMVDVSASSISPILISCTRSKPPIITFMFDSTTASPKRPNFFSYCLCTMSWYCSSLIW